MKIPENIYTAANDASSISINEFDQFSILKDMLTNKKNSKLKKVSMPFKSYTKSLTARLTNINSCDGNTEWSETSNEHDLYHQNVKCIGTNPDDFEMGDPVSIDLQPLSTTFDIMCKLVVINQGAYKERKAQLVSVEPVVQPKIEPEVKPVVETINKPENQPVIETIISEPVIKPEFEPIVEPVKKVISINRIQTDSNDKNKDEIVDTYTYSHELKHEDTSIKSSFVSRKVTKNNDSKEYFNYKVEKRAPKVAEKASSNANETKKNRLVKSASTCTDDLLDGKSIGVYSKYQLLSSDSLHNQQTSLVHSQSAFDDIRFIDEEVNEQANHNKDHVDLFASLDEIPISLNVKNRLGSNVKPKEISVNKIINSNNNNNNNYNNTNEETEISINIPIRPKRSTEWSLFKKQETNNTPNPIYYKSFTQSIVNKTESKISHIVTHS